jgi:hypothetical protein
MPGAFVQVLDIDKKIIDPVTGIIPTFSHRHGTRHTSGPEGNNGNA